MRQTPVYIICSPRPLVGKTLLARLLCEFLLLKNGTVTAFDVNLKEPSLLDFLGKALAEHWSPEDAASGAAAPLPQRR